MEFRTVKRRSREYFSELEKLAEEYNSNGKKTLLLASDSFFPVFDGVINVVDNYAKRLSERMNVLVLVPSYHGEVILRDGYAVLGCTALFSEKIYYQVALPALDMRARKILKKFRIDLIHCHTPFFVGRYTLALARRRKIPLINTFHTQFKRDFIRFVGNNFLVNILMWFIMKPLKNSDEIWTMNEAVGGVLTSYGYKGGFRYIPNATSMLPPENYEEERRRGREKLGAAADEPLLIFVGRIVLQKNIMFLAEVLGELKRRGFHFKMVFVGEGPDEERLRKKVKEEGLEDEVIFTGQITSRQEVCDIYSAGDLFLFPSEYDAHSLVQIEAASRYTPTVFAEGSVTSFSATKDVNSYMFPCEKEIFAQGIIDIFSDREKLAEVSKNVYRDLYVTWDTVMEMVASGYDEVMKKGKK